MKYFYWKLWKKWWSIGGDGDADDDDIFTILIVSVSCFKLWQTLCFATDWSSHCHTHGDDDDDKGVVGDGV